MNATRFREWSGLKSAGQATFRGIRAKSNANGKKKGPECAPHNEPPSPSAVPAFAAAR
jgi:hypothetical protein